MKDSHAGERGESCNLVEIAARRDEGESIASLAAEYRIDESTLRRRLKRAGLLPTAQELPNDEIVALCSEGETAKSITLHLRDRNFRVSERTVRRILDTHGAPRLRRRRTFPLSRDDLAKVAELHRKGTSLTALAKEYLVDQKALKRELLAAGHTIFSHRGHPRQESKKGGGDLRNHPESSAPQSHEQIMVQLPHDEVIERYEGGESVSRIVMSLNGRGIRATSGAVEQVLDRWGVIRHSKPGEIPRGSFRGFSSSTPPRLGAEKRRAEPKKIPPGKLDRIAREHKAGQGVAISVLAARNGISPSILSRTLREAGYTVSSYREWKQRKLVKLTDVIVRMYRDEEKSLDQIVQHLQEHDVFVTPARVRALLKHEGVTLRPVQTATEVRVRNASPPLRRNPPRLHGVPPSEPRWLAIYGREEELANRILRGEETVRKIAEELGLDHNWLTAALKKTGHLPDVNLARLRKQMRLKEEK